jgi:hypothetical protein
MSSVEMQAFFEAYEQNSAADDIDSLVLQYADLFMTADPSGARVVQASELRAALPKRKALFKAIGCKATTLMSLEETPLDDHYVMVRTSWRWEFDRPERPEISLPSTFIVRKSGGALKIVFYLTHQDIMTVLRNHGLLPAPAP